MRVAPGRLGGRVVIPGSKSHTIRALLIAAAATGTSRIVSPLESSDTFACVGVLRQLGVEINEVRLDNGDLSALVVNGTGGVFLEPRGDLDCGNSGTTFYLALSLAALQDFPIRLTGDEQLRRRSAGPLLSSLEDLGARVTREGVDSCPPVTVQGPAAGGSTTIECSTSQYLSSLLLAAPLYTKGVVISVPLLNERPYVEITLGWLDSQKITYDRDGWDRFVVQGGQAYASFERSIPGDFSAATFFLAAAAVTGSVLTLSGLDVNDTQGDRGIVEVLRNLGCEIAVEAATQAALTITGPSGQLAGGTIDLNSMPDALPALAVVGTMCDSPLTLANVPQAREKETDRIAVMTSVLRRLGGEARELPDGIEVAPQQLTGGEADSHGDHRVAMALAVAGLCSKNPVTVTDANVAAITYPGFYQALRTVGAQVAEL